MLLSDRETHAALAAGAIHIIPRPDDRHFSSTAVDLTLDKPLLIWKVKEQTAGALPAIRPFGPNFSVKKLMDDSGWAEKVEISATDGFLFNKQGQFILTYTRERICLPHGSRIAGRVEGKSSLARLGIGIHVTAPTIHAGFGYSPDAKAEETAQPIQLEMFNLSGLPVVLEIGMPICQLILEEVREVPIKGYQGQFNQQPAFTIQGNQ